MSEIRSLGLDGVYEIVPRKFGDARGFFSETYNARELRQAGLDLTFVQDNHSHSATRGVLRGLHYQVPPMAQDKLVRVVRGRIFDVAVDIRRGSATYMKWVGIELSAKAWNQILVPKGFAHGFVTLDDDTEVIYKVTEYYSPEHERAIRFDDPVLAIEWPVAGNQIMLSAKDEAAVSVGDAALFD